MTATKTPGLPEGQSESAEHLPLTNTGAEAVSSFPQTPDQEVLWEELTQIAQRRHAILGEAAPDAVAKAPRDQQAYEEAAKQEMVGLAFSGGGIRSATFNLGLLQGLAKLGLLKYVDYLSTVSGGGYIGSWLAAWIQRAGLATVERELQPSRIDQIPPDNIGKPRAAVDEPTAIFHLRRFSNYLSPKLGLLSADMWVLLATYLRNFLMCQLVLLPATVGVLLISRLLMLLYHTQTPDFVVDFLVRAFHMDGQKLIETDQWALGGVVALLWLLASFFAFRGSGNVRPDSGSTDEKTDEQRLKQRSLIRWVVRPVVLAAVLFCWFPALRLYETNHPSTKGVDQLLVLGIPGLFVPDPDLPAPAEDAAGSRDLDWGSFQQYVSVRTSTRNVFLAFALFPAVVVLMAYLLALPFHHTRRDWLDHMGCTAAACVVGGILLFFVWAFLLWLCQSGPGELNDYVQARAAARVTTFGPPLVLSVVVVTIFIGIALLRNRIGEELREWWSRLCAWLMIFGVTWMLVNLVAIYATAVVLWAGPWLQTLLGSGWIITVLGGVMAGGSARTSATTPSNSLLNWFAALAPAVFVAGMLIGLSVLMHVVLDAPPNWQRVADTAEWGRRTEPLYPSIRITETKFKHQDKAEKQEHKEVVEKASVFNESVVVGLVYWLSMFNTDSTFVPKPNYQLEQSDIRYLQKQRGLDKQNPQIARMLKEIVEKKKGAVTPEQFFDEYKAALDLLKPKLPGDVTRDEILEIATDAQMIDFNPGLLFVKLFVGLIICCTLFQFAARVVDVNRFSLHSLYGNRLTRCYLGASNKTRSPDPFTGFDPTDDLNLAAVQVKDGKYDGPFLLVNTALNLVAGKELAWQERKAESFVMTPLKCGSQDTGYCATSDYANNLRLSTAMTISGAAASPNSGYNSSPAVTALLTVFNARLGAWLGNPSCQESRNEPSPKSGFLYLLKELFGLTSSGSDYIYLSDGGHFENLGGYELVRRRCRYIIVSDADADGDHVFENLGNLIRKVRSDFGIRIEIDLEALRLAADTGRTRWHCAVGKIRYDDVDFGAIPGTLIYIKPSLTGDESADILHYKSANPTFPHETTLDQFFSESQFESYRGLGQHIAEAVLTDALDDVIAELTEERPATATAARQITCQALFTSVMRRWFALPPGYESSFIQTTQNYIDLQKTFSENAEMHPITQAMYPELPVAKLPVSTANTIDQKDGASRQPSVELHSLLRMLQVLENAWLSLNLDVCYAHPLNRGWMDVFYRWTSTPLFRTHWPLLRAEFSRGFVEFCERQLRSGRINVVIEQLKADAAIPEVLTREFSTQWPQLVGLQQRWVEAKDAGLAFLIYSGMIDITGTAPLPDQRVPVGIVILVPQAGQDASGKSVHELVVWIRGAYRNTGIGREALRKIFRELADIWQNPYQLRVTLPISALQGPGGDMLKGMWLVFFHHFGFECVSAVNPTVPAWPSVATDADVVLQRDFAPK